jgi:hypothetical protein
MDQQAELESKRREVAEELLDIKERIPSARILNFLGRAFEEGSPGYWVSNLLFLNLIALGPWLLVGYALNELQRTKLFEIPIVITSEGVIIGLLVAHFSVRYVFDDVANRVIKKINNADDLDKILLWFKKTWSPQNIISHAIWFCLAWIILGIVTISIPLHQFVGVGFSLTIIVNGALVGLVFHIPIWVGRLVSSLQSYHYEMNAFSPAKSEIVNDISEMLSRFIFVMAAFFAVITLAATSRLVDQQTRMMFSIPLVLTGWLTITAQFIATRLTLGKIVESEKWRTLNRLQTKINFVESTGDLSDKETAERLLRLVDIHEKIASSKTNTFDLKSVSTLFSQLMLPLLGLLLGNFDKVLKLLSE